MDNPLSSPWLPFVRRQLVTERPWPRATVETASSFAARSSSGRRTGGEPSRRICVRSFLAFAFALCLGDLPTTAAAERDSPRAATPADDGEDQVVEEPSRLYAALGYASFAGSAGDLLSTEYRLAGSGPELNPLLQNRGIRIGSNVAFPFATNYLTEELRKDGHPKIALWCRVAVVALKGYAIVHNLRAGTR